MLLIYCMSYNHYRLNFSTASERQHPDDLTTPTVTNIIIIMLPNSQIALRQKCIKTLTMYVFMYSYLWPAVEQTTY